MSFYSSEERFLVAVDGIVIGFKDNQLFALITQRRFEPLKGGHSLMGGFVKSEESIDQAAQRVLKECTGLDNLHIEQVGAYGELNRDLGSRVISIAYYALINIEEFDEKLNKQYNTKWVNIKEVGDLVFDHNTMLHDTLKKLRRRAATHPVVFNLLPTMFTLPTLQQLYEVIYDTEIDKRNFRKRLLQMDILERTEEKDKQSSKRGAYYHTFNKQRYEELVRLGTPLTFV